MALPQFDDAGLKRLRELGVSDAQVECLRHALVDIRRAIRTKPKKKDTGNLLREIEGLADELSRKMAALILQPSPEYAFADLLIEEGYWKQPGRMTDDGPTAVIHLRRRLTALAVAARAGRKALPKTQARSSAADPRAVHWVNEALLNGWLDDHRAHVDAGLPLPAYPDAFHASKNEKGAFREIVGLCFAAVGGNPDPERAIKAFLAMKRAKNQVMDQEIMAAIDKALPSP